jgi:hypothetical protein
VIKLVEAHEKEQAELDQEALGHFEKSVFFAPWDRKARDKLGSAVKALSRDEKEETEVIEHDDDTTVVGVDEQ